MSLFNPPHLYIEIGQSTLKLMRESGGLELALERQDNGLLAPAGKAKVIQSLREHLRLASWLPKPKAYCAINARGVSLRRLKLPPARGEEFQRLMRLQIENEFPLPPDELAWGCQAVAAGQPSGEAAAQEWVVAAVKKEILDDYATLLGPCGVEPVFTLGALARRGLCAQAPDAYAILDVAAQGSELMAFERGLPVSMRVIPWGEENILRALQTKMGISRDQAQQLRLRARANPADPNAATLQACAQAEWAALEKWISGGGMGTRLFVAGADAVALAAWLGQNLAGAGIVCEPLASFSGQGRSAATLGLRHFCEQNGGAPPLVFEAAAPQVEEEVVQLGAGKWAAWAAVLAVCAFGLRYAEPVLFQSRLAGKIAEIQAKRDKLPNIDRELAFLQYLKTNQPPYMEAVAQVAKAAPSGMRVESLTLNRRGDLAYRGFVRDMQQALDFRSKLGESGFFANVVLEEQSPTPDRQKMNLRIVAQWKPVAAREAWIKEMALPENNATNAPGTDAKPGAPVAQTMPVGMPSGVVMPSGADMPPGMSIPPGMNAPPGGPPPGPGLPVMEGAPPPDLPGPPGAANPGARPARRVRIDLNGGSPAVVERKE
jgi:Tfp pilus assembly PilM family ATPase